MEKNKQNSEHYHWGDNCSGWHLIQSQHLSIIEELMPPNTAEQKHYHQLAEQFFYILSGTASFKIAEQSIQIEAGSGIHINAQTIHQIENQTNADLIFLVISQPGTCDDRINAPFDSNIPINLNHKKFKALHNTDNGEVGAETVFHYRQKDDIIWATYGGSAIKFGTLSGQIKGNELFFHYQHQNLNEKFMTGKCRSTIEHVNNKIRLHESWEWTNGDFSKGTSILEEV